MARIFMTACAVATGLGIFAGAATAAESHRFCGGETHQMVPADLENAMGDMTLEAISQQPASMTFCSYGYWAEKCGDHETANLIFDRCIAAGYTGALIWKALMYENGNGVPQDDAKATALLYRAATSGNSGYATLGKVHYASALYLGKGVERNEAEARKWFEAAAAEGSQDAQEFLRTGHHTADLDFHGNGVGVAASPVSGQKLAKVDSADHPVVHWLRWPAALLLATVFALGLLRQGRTRASAADRHLGSEGT